MEGGVFMVSSLPRTNRYSTPRPPSPLPLPPALRQVDTPARDEDEASPGSGTEEPCCRVVSETVVLAESAEMGSGDVSFRADASLSPGDPEWANYVKGVVKEYMGKVREARASVPERVVGLA